ncbi:hypothetical protein [Rhodococcus erythropolis]|nr:hypothetical protein [Rhodococcus erythropolis]MCW2300640.1 hypothetical protein [Rhodococcus erythropolis]
MENQPLGKYALPDFWAGANPNAYTIADMPQEPKPNVWVRF